MNAQQGVAAAARQERHSLAIDVDGLHRSRGERVLERETILELTKANGKRLVPRDTEVRVVLLYDAREVVHEKERPAVGNLGFSPEEDALQVERVLVLTALMRVSVARLSIAVEFDAALQFLEPLLLRQFVKLYSAILGDGYGHPICIEGVRLPHRCRAAEDSQRHSQRLLK